MAFSTSLSDSIITTHLKTSNTYLSLWRTDPLDDGSGTEETGTGYARFQMTPSDWAAIYDLEGGRATHNLIVVDFGTVGAGGWGSSVGYGGVHSASTGTGNLLFHHPFEGGAVDLSVAGTPFFIPVGAWVEQVGT